jgi:cation diffusion facilitator CzcD-associated flavoprotein CzcO
MTDYDAIVIGAGHNGLTAAVLLQKAGLRTVCLDPKLYAGGMASTVELSTDTSSRSPARCNSRPPRWWSTSWAWTPYPRSTWK